jgi:hypothetical protein
MASVIEDAREFLYFRRRKVTRRLFIRGRFYYKLDGLLYSGKAIIKMAK